MEYILALLVDKDKPMCPVQDRLGTQSEDWNDTLVVSSNFRHGHISQSHSEEAQREQPSHCHGLREGTGHWPLTGTHHRDTETGQAMCNTCSADLNVV